MALQSVDWSLKKGLVVNRTATNGGRMSAVALADDVSENVFSSIGSTERDDGAVLYEKIFAHAGSANSDVGNSCFVCLTELTPGGTRSYLISATQRDTQGDISSPRKFGIGLLDADIVASATSLVLNFEAGSGADLVIQAGDTLFLKDDTSSERVVIAAGGVSWSTDEATVTLDTGIRHNYTTADNCVGAACMNIGTVQANFDNWVETSTSGSYDESTYAITLDGIATTDESITVTFTSGTNFDVIGDSLGALGSGSTGADFIYVNPDYSRNNFVILASGWAGTWATSETITFQNHPASIPFFWTLVVPIGTTALAVDTSKLRVIFTP